MGKRKSRKIKVRRSLTPKLDKDFECPFCSNQKSIGVAMDRKRGLASLSCRVCRVSFQAPIHPYSEPIDVYALWIDSCEETNRDAGIAGYEEEEPVTYKVNSRSRIEAKKRKPSHDQYSRENQHDAKRRRQDSEDETEEEEEPEVEDDDEGEDAFENEEDHREYFGSEVIQATETKKAVGLKVASDFHGHAFDAQDDEEAEDASSHNVVDDDLENNGDASVAGSSSSAAGEDDGAGRLKRKKSAIRWDDEDDDEDE